MPTPTWALCGLRTFNRHADGSLRCYVKKGGDFLGDSSQVKLSTLAGLIFEWANFARFPVRWRVLAPRGLYDAILGLLCGY